MSIELRSMLRRPISLVLDWDGTLTRKDTLAFVGQIGYQQHARSGRKDPPSLPPWGDLVSAYIDNFTAHQSSYLPATESRNSVKEERDWLCSLAPIEDQSVRRVERSKLFRGVTARDVSLTANEAVKSGDLQLRDGWLELFRRTRGSNLASKENQVRGSNISILSVNWSEHFIRCALRGALGQTHRSGRSYQPDDFDAYIQSMEILANEIEGVHCPGGSDGCLSKSDSAGIRTSADKLTHMPERCRQRLDLEAGAKRPILGSDERTVIYVGDSATDLEALLAADVGVCIRDEPMGSGQRELAHTLKRLGVEVVHLNEAHWPKGEESMVYWVNNLMEIADLLLAADH